MSGTSLDGMDFALCIFQKNDTEYSYNVIKTGFFEYDKSRKQKLSEAQYLSAYDFVKFHKQYGKFIGQQINKFLQGIDKPDFIASHGHTIFHKPEENATFQIGDGAFIAAETGIPVISDFRNLDTAIGGQGAPLVPVGDKLLFSEYDYCLNLGGFANISYDDENKKRIAFDICPFNFIINKFAQSEGKEFDKNGEIGKEGNIHTELLSDLNNILYYKSKIPKSLGREYAEKIYLPLFDKYNISAADKINTYYEHAANKIYDVIKPDNEKNILITGGGAYNRFFISLLQKKIKSKIVIPDKELIDFKEAIIFGFLGFLRSINEANTLKSVTGAKKDSSGGSVFIIS